MLGLVCSPWLFRENGSALLILAYAERALRRGCAEIATMLRADLETSERISCSVGLSVERGSGAGVQVAVALIADSL
jgi:hypothetical protein